MHTIYQFDHQPVEHFGRLGYERLASLVDDYSHCPSDEWDDSGERQRRWLDVQVLFALRDGWPKTKRDRRMMTSDEPRERVVGCSGIAGDNWHGSVADYPIRFPALRIPRRRRAMVAI